MTFPHLAHLRPLSALARKAVVLLAFSVSFALGAEAADDAAGVPDDNVLARLVWTSLIALDNANRTTNYDVFFALTAPSYQESHTVEDVASSFAPLRAARVDVGRALLITPKYYLPPHITDEGLLRLRGGFEFRPTSLRFDMLFEPADGAWRINAISVAEMNIDDPR